MVLDRMQELTTPLLYLKYGKLGSMGLCPMEKENTSPLILSSNVGSRCYLICIYLRMLPLILFITLHAARWSLLRTQMLNCFAFVQVLNHLLVRADFISLILLLSCLP